MARISEDEHCTQHAVIAFRASAALLANAEKAAAAEGISRSDVARRALIRDLAGRSEPERAA